MKALSIALWVLPLFFAASWTLGVLTQPRFRLKSIIVTVVYWWTAIAFVYLAPLHVAHLLYLMPIALIIPSALQLRLLMTSSNTVGTIFLLGGLIFGPALALAYLLDG